VFLGIRWEPFMQSARVLAVVDSWYVTWPLRIGVTWFLLARRRWEAAWAWAWAWVVASVIYETLVDNLKSVYERERLPEPLASATHFSFPSGHVTVGAVVAIGLVIVLVPAGRRRRKLEVLADWRHRRWIRLDQERLGAAF
jgi:membrane-associated phospholipid phosphatase